MPSPAVLVYISPDARLQRFEGNHAAIYMSGGVHPQTRGYLYARRYKYPSIAPLTGPTNQALLYA